MKNKVKFKPGDRVVYMSAYNFTALTGEEGVVVGSMFGSPDYFYVRFDNQKLPYCWELLESNVKTYPFLYKRFKVGDKYFVAGSADLVLFDKKSKRYSFDKPAIKEQVEQKEVINLTRQFINRLKEAWQ